MRETWVWSLGWEDPLEKEMAIHSNILAWKIPWTEEPGGLQSLGSQRVGHDWVTKHTQTKLANCIKQVAFAMCLILPHPFGDPLMCCLCLIWGLLSLSSPAPAHQILWPGVVKLLLFPLPKTALDVFWKDRNASWILLVEVYIRDFALFLRPVSFQSLRESYGLSHQKRGSANTFM